MPSPRFCKIFQCSSLRVIIWIGVLARMVTSMTPLAPKYLGDVGMSSMLCTPYVRPDLGEVPFSSTLTVAVLW